MYIPPLLGLPPLSVILLIDNSHIMQFTHLKCALNIFSIFTALCNSHHNLILEHFYHLKEEEGSNLTTSSQTIVIACLFCSSCPSGCEVAL